MGALVTALQARAAKLTNESNDLQAQIQDHAGRLAGLTPGSASANAESSTLSTLQGRYADAVQELDAVDRQIGDAELGASLNDEGATVLEKATTATKTSALVTARTVGLGAFVGLVFGAVLALWLLKGDRRLRPCEEIAGAAEAPLLTSVAAARVTGAEQVVALLNEYEPDALDEWGLRQLLASLGVGSGDSPACVVLVALAGDRDAMVLAPQLAAFNAGLGRRTALVVTSPDPGASVLHRACDMVALEPRLLRRDLELIDVETLGERARLERTELLVLLVVAGDDGRLDVPPGSPSAHVVLAVSAGFATADRLGDAARAAIAARRTLSGVVVVNPDRADRTTGQVPAAPLPARSEPLTSVAGRAGWSGR